MTMTSSGRGDGTGVSVLVGILGGDMKAEIAPDCAASQWASQGLEGNALPCLRAVGRLMRRE
jgi:hypothetical protein